MNAPLSPDGAEQIRHLFQKVVDLPIDGGSAFLDAAFRDDPVLGRDFTFLRV